MTAVYSLDAAIGSFFEVNTEATRQQCDDFALHHAGGPLDPVPIQGTFSYTVTAGENKSKIFQFRAQDSSFDTSMINLAKIVHPQFVASCQYHGTIGPIQPLHIYEMDCLPGAAYIMARNVSIAQPPGSILRQCNTVKDLAIYFAQSWNCQQQLSPDDMAALCAEFRSKLDLLAQSLPSRFLPNLNRVYEKLTLVFSGALPFVLSHGDLCEMNILISPETGHLTGIVDWVEARILPFGISLWGFENILGFMDSRGWHYYDNRDQLEDLFWRTFWTEAPDALKADLELIQTARMTGLFCRYGLVVEGKDLKGAIGHSDSYSLAYLDAFCTIDDWEPGIGRNLKPDNIMVKIEDPSIFERDAQDEFDNPLPQKHIDERTIIYLSRNNYGPLSVLTGTIQILDFDLSVRAEPGQIHTGAIQGEIYRAPELWDLLEGRSLFNPTAPGNADEYDDQSHLGQISALIGSPPQSLLLSGQRTSMFYKPNGELKNPGLVPAPGDFSFENTISCMSGEEKVRFIRFIKRMVKWSPEERSTARELLDDPWLYQDFPQD
ncbi:kinase-like domain protein [Fusarium sp. NRRL 25303]|nr:kinase-like domain protein [Fusarium sp. NRRL 25303]